MARILIVDDEDKMRHLLSIMLSRRGYAIEQAANGLEALAIMENTPFDMIISDIKMPQMDGIELLRKIQEMDDPCPVVFITAFATVESAVDAMRDGAVDYISKPFDEDRIVLTVEKTLSLSRILAENRDLKKELKKAAGSEKIVHASKEMDAILNLAFKVAQGDTAVLITGESGTGKELLANYIHAVSPRKNMRFVPVNCAAISPNLVESELFGHEKGSFTGASAKTTGKFEYATGGTLFLDEIGDLSLEAQAKLLRALQEKKIQRVGGNKEIAVDVRVICATNQDLEKLVGTGAFRKDLLFRINVFPIKPPPLRERSEDVIPLCLHFLSQLDQTREIRLTDGAVKVLTEYSWPGNVRELANAMERAMILCDGTTITAQTISFLKTPKEISDGNADFQLPKEGASLEKIEENFVEQALRISGNNQTAAARLLGLTRAKFRVLMKRVNG